MKTSKVILIISLCLACIVVGWAGKDEPTYPPKKNKHQLHSDSLTNSAKLHMDSTEKAFTLHDDSFTNVIIKKIKSLKH